MTGKLFPLALTAAQSDGPLLRHIATEVGGSPAKAVAARRSQKPQKDDWKEEAAVHGEQWLPLKRLAGAADLS